MERAARSKVLLTSRLPVFTADDLTIRVGAALRGPGDLLRQRRPRRRIDVLLGSEDADRVDVEPIAVCARAADQVVGFARLASHQHVVGRRPTAACVLDAPVRVGSLRVVAAVPVVQGRDRTPEERDAFVARGSRSEVPAFGVVNALNDRQRFTRRNRPRPANAPRCPAAASLRVLESAQVPAPS